ncbi:Hypothetical protein NTJ_06012 [Nesidiocoris tenuis]|uniref:Uncharacterized protein n=1 Tax=Nesidiocoris tenuis TaxID=355587 RepID=A0ABN7AMN1_9HEMI|nr:Hypothetical protein NTJ_06012 [Nesidiocoris tenuis]
MSILLFSIAERALHNWSGSCSVGTNVNNRLNERVGRREQLTARGRRTLPSSPLDRPLFAAHVSIGRLEPSGGIRANYISEYHIAQESTINVLGFHT